MRSRRFAALVLGLILASCISTSTTTTASTTTTGAEPSSTTTTSANSLTVWVDDPRYDMVSEAGTAYTERTGVPVDVVRIGFDDAIAAVLDGEGPDVFLASHEHLGELLDAGLVTPVDLGDLDLDPVAVSAVSDKGITYGVPYGLEAVALFSHMGPEATFGDVTGSVGVPNHWYYAYGFMAASGGYLFGDSIDDIGVTRGAAGLEGLQKLVDAGTVVVGPYVDMADGFAAGDLTGLISGPWQVAPFLDLDVDFTVVSLPAMSGMELEPLVGVQAFFVRQDSDLAMAFVEDVVESPDFLTQAAAADDRVPAYLPARDTYPYPGFVTSVDSGQLIPRYAKTALVSDPLTSLFDDVFAGLPPDVETAEAEIRSVVGG